MSWIILILKVIVALGFAVAGAAKLKGTPRLAAQFEEFGFPRPGCTPSGLWSWLALSVSFSGPIQSGHVSDWAC